jgi:hypothetical protein
MAHTIYKYNPNFLSAYSLCTIKQITISQYIIKSRPDLLLKKLSQPRCKKQGKSSVLLTQLYIRIIQLYIITSTDKVSNFQKYFMVHNVV